MLHHVLAWEQSLAEVHWVLRRGGRFVGYDLVRNRVTVWLLHARPVAASPPDPSRAHGRLPATRLPHHCPASARRLPHDFRGDDRIVMPVRRWRGLPAPVVVDGCADLFGEDVCVAGVACDLADHAEVDEAQAHGADEAVFGGVIQGVVCGDFI